MSNRRRLASEKARRERCPRCRGRSFATKVFADHDARVCLTCEHITTIDRAAAVPVTSEGES